MIVNEASARIGGAFEDVFIPWVTGFDILEAVIRMAAGESIAPHTLQTPGHTGTGCQVSAQLTFCRPGAIASVTPLKTLLELPGVLSAGYNYGVGDAIPALQNATARFGHCVLVTENGDMDARLKRYYQTLRVLDARGGNMIIPRTYDGKETDR